MILLHYKFIGEFGLSKTMFQVSLESFIHLTFPANIYLSEVNIRNTRKRCKICSKLIIKTRPMASFWCLYCYLWTYFTPFSSVSIVGFEQVNICWAMIYKTSGWPR